MKQKFRLAELEPGTAIKLTLRENARRNPATFEGVAWFVSYDAGNEYHHPLLELENEYGVPFRASALEYDFELVEESKPFEVVGATSIKVNPDAKGFVGGFVEAPKGSYTINVFNQDPELIAKGVSRLFGGA